MLVLTGAWDSDDAPTAGGVLLGAALIGGLALSIVVIFESEGRDAAGERLLTLGLVLIPLVGLGVMGEWLGFALVLAASPILTDRWLERSASRWWLQSLLLAVVLGVVLEGLLAVLEDRGYDIVIAGVIAAIAIAARAIGHLWQLRSRRRPA